MSRDFYVELNQDATPEEITRALTHSGLNTTSVTKTTANNGG